MCPGRSDTLNSNVSLGLANLETLTPHHTTIPALDPHHRSTHRRLLIRTAGVAWSSSDLDTSTRTFSSSTPSCSLLIIMVLVNNLTVVFTRHRYGPAQQLSRRVRTPSSWFRISPFTLLCMFQALLRTFDCGGSVELYKRSPSLVYIPSPVSLTYPEHHHHRQLPITS